jgi:4-amino-4-deoxy-L-arabinose transferase-like glycosyltransferase
MKRQLLTKLGAFCLIGAVTFTHVTPAIVLANETNKSYVWEGQETDLVEIDPHMIKTFTSLNAAAKYIIGGDAVLRPGTALTWQTFNRAVTFSQQSNGLWTARTASQTIRDIIIR